MSWRAAPPWPHGKSFPPFKKSQDWSKAAACTSIQKGALWAVVVALGLNPKPGPHPSGIWFTGTWDPHAQGTGPWLSFGHSASAETVASHSSQLTRSGYREVRPHKRATQQADQGPAWGRGLFGPQPFEIHVPPWFSTDAVQGKAPIFLRAEKKYCCKILFLDIGQFWVDTGVTFKRCGEAERAGEGLQSTQESWVLSLNQEGPLEEGIATHSSILAWIIPWTEQPGRLQSVGLQRVRHDWSNWAQHNLWLRGENNFSIMSSTKLHQGCRLSTVLTNQESIQGICTQIRETELSTWWVDVKIQPSNPCKAQKSAYSCWLLLDYFQPFCNFLKA